ncbi:hypothetical protein [Marinicella sp. W31]|uniref:hypothetical protein n=1 Tax=Marinicella sp. W31 TaxID=3023713 RepID=UPI0037574463
MTAFHIIAGAIAILSGFAALFYRKGASKHRQAGNIFFFSMLCMAGSGAIMAYWDNESLSVIAGTLTCYMVATSWSTIRQKPAQLGAFEFMAPVIGFSIAISGYTLGLQGLENEDKMMDGFPAEMYFFFASIAGLAAVFDLKVLIRKGISGAARIVRHLWRMCYGLWMAVTSFFLGQQKLFPDWLIESKIHIAPVLLVVILLIFWLLKVAFGRRFKKLKQAT